MIRNKPGLVENNLQVYRRRKALSLKKVASLIGRKTTFQLSRYETGSQLPSLKTALKLAIIYNIPVEALLAGYLEACRQEIRHESRVPTDSKPKRATQIEFCTIEEKLAAAKVDAATLDKVSGHAAKLIRERAAKLDHY